VATTQALTRKTPLLQAIPLCAIVWGALAFGAVYPWAYWPLAAACLASGAVGLAVRPSVEPAGVSRAFTWALVASAAAIVAQLLPVPAAVVSSISPHTIALARELNPIYATGEALRYPLSVWPRDTWTALALYASLAALCVGMTRLLSASGSRWFVEALTGFGTVLALIGLIQQSLSSRSLYGLWELEIGRTPFGPFVNRNHFAGWMLMALPLTLSLLVAGIDQGMKAKRGWRNKVLWFSSPEASRLILIAAAAAVMALSLMLTMSRSGITAFLLSLLVTGWFVERGVKSRSRRLVAASCLALLVLAVVVWTGPELVATRFAEADWGEFNNRKGAWLDAWNVARSFPIAGTGLNTYWAAALFYQRHEMAYFFAQAHNDYLQLAAEGGFLVVVPALACLALFVRDVRRATRQPQSATTRWLRAGAITSLIAIAFQETVEFSLQMPGDAALFAIVCAIAMHRPTADVPTVGHDGPESSGRTQSRGRVLQLVPPSNFAVKGGART
jgi:O-antigen ligase